MRDILMLYSATIRWVQSMQTLSVTKTELPDFSALNKRRVPRDFLDCYTVAATMTAREAANIITDFPVWARFLLLIRRAITTPFGLNNDGPNAVDRVGIFPVESETPEELIAGFNDKHLNFRISVLAHSGRVSLATWVSPHNFGGRIYLATIMPFHIVIARNAVMRVGQVSKAR